MLQTMDQIIIIVEVYLLRIVMILMIGQILKIMICGEM